VRKDQLQLNSLDLSTLQNTFPPLIGSTVPRVSATLPFQPGTNFKPRTSAGLELVVQLPIVQAPFRIYWAYNFNRMSQVITAPQTQFPGPVSLADLTSTCIGTAAQCPWNIYKAQIGGLQDQPEIWNGQVAPAIINLFNNPQRTNFFDPVRTFRFTVSRTF
jgi:outer membrane protein insertion porin family